MASMADGEREKKDQLASRGVRDEGQDKCLMWFGRWGTDGGTPSEL